MSLEARINGLLSSWNIESPFAVALKLVIDEWNLGNNQEVNTEKDLYKEQYLRERFYISYQENTIPSPRTK